MQPDQQPAPEEQPQPKLQHELTLTPNDSSLTASDAMPTVHVQPVNIADTPSESTQKVGEGSASPTDPATPGQSEEPKLTSQEYKTPWFKLIAMGILAPVFALVVYILIAFTLVKFLSFELIFRLFQFGFMQLFLVGLLLFGLYRVYQRLSKWMIASAGIITIGTFLLIVTSTLLVRHLQTYSFYNLIFSGGVGHIQKIAANLGLFIVPLAGVIGLLVLTFIFNNLTKPSKTIRTIIAFILVLSPYFVTFVYTPTPNFSKVTSSAKAASKGSDEILIPMNNTVVWGFLPTKLPAGVTGIKECANEPAGPYIGCDLKFTDYPGYLSAASQQKITASFNNGAGPSEESFKLPSQPWVSFKETEDDKNFAPYLYNAGKCDISGLEGSMSLSAQYRTKNATPAKPTTCTKITTPNGTTVYRQDITQNGIPQPNQYYFVKENTVIVLNHNQYSGNSSTKEAQYFVDPNYQTQFNQFVDSFTKNS